jgi:DNA polymerase/3'-5' exonuclease PolX
MKLTEALPVAQALLDHFEPACREIKIAGSLRRGKAEVKDIELVCVPNDTPPEKPKLEFGKPIPPAHKTMLDELVHGMAQAGDVQMELNGDRLKRMYLKYAGIKCELFINVPPSEWGVQFLIRTGPSDFSHWCVTSRKFGGALPDGYFVKHQVVWIADEISKQDMPPKAEDAVALLTDTNHLSMPEEVDFLNFLELGWLEPGERRAKWKR